MSECRHSCLRPYPPIATIDTGATGSVRGAASRMWRRRPSKRSANRASAVRPPCPSTMSSRSSRLASSSSTGRPVGGAFGLSREPVSTSAMGGVSLRSRGNPMPYITYTGLRPRPISGPARQDLLLNE